MQWTTDRQHLVVRLSKFFVLELHMSSKCFIEITMIGPTLYNLMVHLLYLYIRSSRNLLVSTFEVRHLGAALDDARWKTILRLITWRWWVEITSGALQRVRNRRFSTYRTGTCNSCRRDWRCMELRHRMVARSGCHSSSCIEVLSLEINFSFFDIWQVNQFSLFIPVSNQINKWIGGKIRVLTIVRRILGKWLA